MSRVLFVGGWDPAALAGVAVDLRVAAALGVEAGAVLTTVTAQPATGAATIAPVASQLFARQLDAVGSATVVKLGALGSTAQIEALAPRLRRAFVICDPVLRTSAGTDLLPTAALPAMRALLPRIDLLTPNLDEAERLCALTPGALRKGPRAVEEAASALLARGVRAVLVKGGHAGGRKACDLFAAGNTRVWLAADRGTGARGTGCALGAAIACALAWGKGRTLDLLDAIVVGKAYVRRGLRAARSAPVRTRALHHAPWPVADIDYPIAHPRPALRFPSLDGALGLYPIVDRAADLEPLARAGVTIAQLRIKDLDGQALRAEITRALAIARRSKLRLVVNDHAALARELGAWGVHLGQEDLAAISTAELRALAEAGLRIGVSTHTYAELAHARSIGTSYVALGPIYPTTLKCMRYPPQGPGRIAEWRQLAGAPVVAIGGITLDRVAELGAADGIAVLSDLRRGGLERRARAYLRAISGERPAARA